MHAEEEGRRVLRVRTNCELMDFAPVLPDIMPSIRPLPPSLSEMTLLSNHISFS